MSTIYVRRKQEIEDKLRYAVILNNIAVLYRRMEKCEKSEEYLLKAAEIWSNYSRESTGKYTVLLAQAYAELALTVKKSRKKSADYHRMSEEMIDKFSSSAKKYARKKVEISLLP